MPRLLPEADRPTITEDLSDISRLRELALSTLVESTSQQRLNRAMKHRTRPAGERFDYRPGQLVDLHRPANQKTASGWRGPAEVVAAHNQDGYVDVKWRGRVLSVRFADLRMHILAVFMLQMEDPSMTSIRNFLKTHQLVQYTRAWLLLHRSGRMEWQLSRSAREHQDIT